MKKSTRLTPLCCLSIVTIGHVALAETIIWPDDSGSVPLAPSPYWSNVDDSLFPQSGSSNNEIIFNSGDVAGDVYGGVSTTSAADNNLVTINGGTIGGYVHGGISDYGSVNNNLVTVNDGTMVGVYGGYSFGLDLNNNQIVINGGNIDFAYAADTYRGNAYNNSITITGGSVSRVYGGFSGIGTASGNSVTVTGGNVNYVSGGYSYEGTVSDNVVTIGTGVSVLNVYGGESYQTATVTRNRVEVSGSADYIFGGYSASGNVSENTVTFNGSYAIRVYGGYVVDGGLVSGNSVTIDSGIMEARAQVRRAVEPSLATGWFLTMAMWIMRQAESARAVMPTLTA